MTASFTVFEPRACFVPAQGADPTTLCKNQCSCPTTAATWAPSITAAICSQGTGSATIVPGASSIGSCGPLTPFGQVIDSNPCDPVAGDVPSGYVSGGVANSFVVAVDHARSTVTITDPSNGNSVQTNVTGTVAYTRDLAGAGTLNINTVFLQADTFSIDDHTVTGLIVINEGSAHGSIRS